MARATRKYCCSERWRVKERYKNEMWISAVVSKDAPDLVSIFSTVSIHPTTASRNFVSLASHHHPSLLATQEPHPLLVFCAKCTIREKGTLLDSTYSPLSLQPNNMSLTAYFSWIVCFACCQKGSARSRRIIAWTTVKNAVVLSGKITSYAFHFHPIPSASLPLLLRSEFKFRQLDNWQVPAWHTQQQTARWTHFKFTK